MLPRSSLHIIKFYSLCLFEVMEKTCHMRNKYNACNAHQSCSFLFCLFMQQNISCFLKHIFFIFICACDKFFLNVIFWIQSHLYTANVIIITIDETVEYLLPHLQPYRPNSISLMPAPQARRLGLIGMYVCM